MGRIDPERAALAMIIALPAEMLHSDRFALVLCSFAALLAEDHCFAGLCWPDAKRVATAICHELVGGSADRLHIRGRDALAAAAGMGWGGRGGAGRGRRI